MNSNPADESTVLVLNTPCQVSDARTLQRRMECWLTQHGPNDPALSVDFTNVHIVAARWSEENFRDTTASVNWFVPDSQVLTWAVNILSRGKGRCRRVYGPTFLDHSIRHGATHLNHYFLGGSQDCLDKLLAHLRAIQPDLQIAGQRNGYFATGEEETVAREIAESKADLIWVGLGTPKQQAFMDRWKHLYPGKILLAVGFAFDVNAGTKKDAPTWMGPLGLTWLYRLVREPRRLAKRYIKYNSIFLYGFFRQLIRGSQS